MAERLNKAEQAYELLEEMITFRELEPGTMISESALMELTGLGRTPVREAIQRLARERVVEIHPNRGIFIAQLSVDQQLRLLELRRVVEELAVRLAAERAEPHQREQMAQLADDLANFAGDDVRQFAHLLKRAHRSIDDAAHNDYLQVAMAPLQGLSRRFWFAHLHDVEYDLRQASVKHSAILRAICSGDQEAAAKASIALNDYLTEFAYETLRGPRITRSTTKYEAGARRS